MSKYGKKRDSLVDLEEELFGIINSHPDSVENSDGEFAVPASSLADVLRIYREHHDGVQLFTEDEEAMIDVFVHSNPGLEVTTSILLNFLAALTKKTKESQSPSASPDNSMQMVEDELVVLDEDDTQKLSSGPVRPPSRSSSQGGPAALPNLSDGLSPANTSITSITSDSIFESAQRRRTAPLNAAPSSWNHKRAMRTHRRRSDAGSSLSDTETPSRSRASSRSRPPSVPASPRNASAEFWNGTMSPPLRSPRSRARSYGQYGSSVSLGSLDGMMSPTNRPRFDRGDGSFERPSRRSADSTSNGESDSEDLDLILDNSLTRSRAEMEAQEREDTLRRANEELQRQVVDQDRILQNKISEHEAELEALQIALEETKSELSMSKREEKELRAKEIRYNQQIAALESDIAKRQKVLESTRQSHTSLQKQYQEQCTESENLRNILRLRDQQCHDQGEKISLHGIEINKYQQNEQHLEQQILRFEAQLLAAQETEAQLDEQKQENLLLKETIDRMRYDMDELRAKADGNLLSSSASRISKADSMGSTLGVELARLSQRKWPDGGTSDSEDESATAASDNGQTSETESEDVVQTIITRRKKRVTSRTVKESVYTEDTKIYSDAYTQHELSEFVSSSTTQTDPEPEKSLVVACIQTDNAIFGSMSVQTEPEDASPRIVKCEMEIQTDGTGQRKERDMNAIASSSSMRDLPPSYAESSKVKQEQEERDLNIAAEAVRKWHKGLDVPLLPLQDGVSEDAIEEWAALKAEIGIECLAIDKVLEMSLKTGQPRHLSRRSTSASSSRETSSEDSNDKSQSHSRSRRSRFYNIYNTFVYGDADGEHVRDRERSLSAGLSQAALVLGVFVLAAGVLSGPYMQQQYYAPGGPTYYDRAAWSEFNRLYPVGEGFALDGAATVWDFIGRVGGEAARMARGWPS